MTKSYFRIINVNQSTNFFEVFFLFVLLNYLCASISVHLYSKPMFARNLAGGSWFPKLALSQLVRMVFGQND